MRDMEFRQPNSLARTLHRVLNDLIGGQRVTLSFGTEAEVRRVLEVLHEVTTDRRVAVTVRAVGQRSLELTLTEEEHAA